jgi:hypothetical protein
MLQDMSCSSTNDPVTEVQDLAALLLWRPHCDRRIQVEHSLDIDFHT